jgi:endonuclease/exonuclease/phosphatase family metal-dependent hydrolase
VSTQSSWLFVFCALLVACSLPVDPNPSPRDAAPEIVVTPTCDSEPPCDVRQQPGVLPLVCPRLQRCDVDAAPLERLRVASWNIKVGAVQGLAAVIEVLRRLDADVVMLQEVDSRTERTGRVDQALAIASALGLQYAFAPTITLEGGEYGIAILSRLEFLGVERISLTNEGAAEPRTALDVLLCAGSQELRAINHHADYRTPGANRSILEVLAALVERPRGHTIFAGDFNLTPTDPGPLACLDAGFVDAVVPFDPGATYGSSRLDYIFVDEAMDDWILNAEVDAAQASDHRALVVDIALHPMTDP